MQFEKRLFVEVNALLEQRQKADSIINQPLINALAKADYLASRPGATQQQKDHFARLRAYGDPILQRSSRSLIPLQILRNSIQDDLKAQPGGGQ